MFEVKHMNDKKLIIRKGEDGHRMFSVRMKESIAEQLDEIAAKSNRSRNELINMFMEFAIENCVIEG